MNRVVAIVIAVLVAAGLVVLLADPFGNRRNPEAEKELFALLRQRDPARARAFLDEHKGGLGDDAVRFAEGVVMVGEGRFAEAVPYLEDAYRTRKDDWIALDFLIAALRNSDHLLTALERAEEFVLRRPGDAHGLWILAQTAFSPESPQRNPARAMEALDRLAPLVAAAEKAAPQTAAQRTPGADDDPLGFTRYDFEKLRCLVAGDLSRHGPAVDAARRAVQARPDLVESWVLLGETCRKAALDPSYGQPILMNEAAQAYGRALQAAPEGMDTFQLQFNFAQMLLDIDGAAETCLRVAQALHEEHPGRTDVDILFARALVRQNVVGKMDEAAVVYEQVLEREPGNLIALRNLAVLLYDWKQGGQRGTYLERARELLTRYVKGGGTIDQPLRDTWETLEAMAAGDRNAIEVSDAFAILHQEKAAGRPDRARLEQAVRLFEAALDSGRDPRPSWYQGLVQALSGLLPERADELERRSTEAYGRFPDDPDIRQLRAESILAPVLSKGPDGGVDKDALKRLADLYLAHPDDPSLLGKLAFAVALAGGTQARAGLTADVPRLTDVGDVLWSAVERLEKQ